LPEEEIAPERRDDWLEVQNYTKAMNHSLAALERLPLSMRLLREAHEILMYSARGEHRNPGEIRKSQNWIGGSNLKNAVFIPPTHHELPRTESLYRANDLGVTLPPITKVIGSSSQVP
jgi:Fic family protein